MFEPKDFLSPGAILVSAVIALVAILANFSINRRNRRIRAAIDLYTSYYSQEFSDSRYALFQFLAQKQEEKGLKWDFEEWYTNAREQNDEKSLKMQSVLNRLLAFYLAMRQLLESKEIDKKITARLFRYAYSYWNPWRARFFAETSEAGKYIFEPISVFKNNIIQIHVIMATGSGNRP